MPSPLQRRRGRRGVGWVLSVATIMSVVGLAAPSYATGDDYPYAGLGQCPLVPLPPVKPKPTDGPGRPGSPGDPRPNTPGHPTNGPHAPDKPGPADQPPPKPRVCAKHIWFYNGSYGDPWGFALRNCTSFVAWRLRMTNGLSDFENHFGGVHWGNADHWDEAASELGYLVDHVPAVGAVAQTDAGRVGHVAWVSAVGDGTVTVEEYNMAVAGGYDVRTVPTSDFRYLHLADTAPAPYLGSTRSAVATADARGGLWSARTTAVGDLVVQRPSGRTVRLGGRGAWSSRAAPSLTTDTRGRVWVAAVAAGGRVLAAHTGPLSPMFSPPRHVLSGSTTSSPALVVDGQGRVRILAVSAAGTLVERHTAEAGHWSRPHRMGVPESWSTHAAPAVVNRQGSAWMAAVTRRGTLLTQHTVHGGRGWTGLRPVDHRSWSSTATPALAAAPDGRVWLAMVGRRGTLEVHHTAKSSSRWQRPDRLPGRWSPYSSPTLAADRGGRTWLAAVGTDGHLAVSWTSPGDRRWHRSRGLPHEATTETHSPSLIGSVYGVLVDAAHRRGHTVWRRPPGPAEPALSTHGQHGAGFTVSRLL
jgi:surface antigen